MKRILVFALLCMLLVATVGTTAVVAEPHDSPQTAKSSIYLFDVTYNGKVVGKLFVYIKDPDAATYVFLAYGLTPLTKYELWWIKYWQTPTPIFLVGSAAANKWGCLHMEGTWTDPAFIAVLKEKNLPFILKVAPSPIRVG
jgi:hypothetical protein